MQSITEAHKNAQRVNREVERDRKESLREQIEGAKSIADLKAALLAVLDQQD